LVVRAYSYDIDDAMKPQLCYITAIRYHTFAVNPLLVLHGSTSDWMLLPQHITKITILY